MNLCKFNFYPICAHIVSIFLFNTWINEHHFLVGDLTSLAFPGYCNVGTIKEFTAIIQFIHNCSIQPHLLYIPSHLKTNSVCFWKLSLSASSTLNQLNMPCYNKWYNKGIAKILNKWMYTSLTVHLYCWFVLIFACLGCWYFVLKNLLQHKVRLFTTYLWQKRWSFLEMSFETPSSLRLWMENILPDGSWSEFLSSKTKDGRVQQFCNTRTIHPLGTGEEEFFIAL